MMTNQHPQNDFLLIPGYKPIQNIQHIVRLKGDGNYTNIYSINQVKPLLVSQTLKYFELQLLPFIRISKSFLINPAYIERVIEANAKTMYLQFADGTSLPVARRRIVDTQRKLSTQFSHYAGSKTHLKRDANRNIYYCFPNENLTDRSKH